MVYFDKPSGKNPTQLLNLDTLTASVPTSPKKYRDNKAASNVLESMMITARVPFKPVAKTHKAKERA